jgi:hypothetical protein
MKSLWGFLLVAVLAYGSILSVGIAMASIFASPLGEELFLVAGGYLLIGALLISSGRNKAGDAYKRAYVSGAGTLGDVKVWPELRPEPSAEGEKLGTSSGMHSQEYIEKTPPWPTAATVGSALAVAGIAMIGLVYLQSFL